MDQVKRLQYLYHRTSADLARIMTFSSEPETRRFLYPSANFKAGASVFSSTKSAREVSRIVSKMARLRVGSKAVDLSCAGSNPAAVRSALFAVRNDGVSNVEVDIPAEPELVRTAKTTLAYTLINRDGPAIQPGSRTYARSWIRDGTLTGTALTHTPIQRG